MKHTLRKNGKEIMVEAAKYLKKSFIVISLLLCLIGLQSVFAQTKFDEYIIINPDDDTARIDNYMEFKREKPECFHAGKRIIVSDKSLRKLFLVMKSNNSLIC
ncbi:MAG: hypothetical protein ACR2J3_04245 [Aridibacter sp.]